MEKEQHDSMATVQMSKADYAASEVYSTTSEPPPVSWICYLLLFYFTIPRNDENVIEQKVVSISIAFKAILKRILWDVFIWKL